MKRYRRTRQSGGTFFFTLVTCNRRPFLVDPDCLPVLKMAFAKVQLQRPFTMSALVVLPDHLHCIWTLPEGDFDYPNRWRLIKTHFTKWGPQRIRGPRSRSRKRHGEQAVWQPRFWERLIRNEQEYQLCLAYILANPVRHGCVQEPREWPFMWGDAIGRQPLGM